MAKPIKETPILKGKDAKVFIEKMLNKHDKISKERFEEMQNNAALIKKMGSKP